MGRALFTNPTTPSNDADTVLGVQDDHDDQSGVAVGIVDGGELGKDDDSDIKKGHDASVLLMMITDPSKTFSKQRSWSIFCVMICAVDMMSKVHQSESK